MSASPRLRTVVVLLHAVDILAVAVLVTAAMRGTNVRAQVHARRIQPDEERLARRVLPLHVIDGCRRGLVIDRLHALLGERIGVFDRLPANLAEARIDRGIILIGLAAVEEQFVGIASSDKVDRLPRTIDPNARVICCRPLAVVGSVLPPMFPQANGSGTARFWSTRRP